MSEKSIFSRNEKLPTNHLYQKSKKDNINKSKLFYENLNSYRNYNGLVNFTKIFNNSKTLKESNVGGLYKKYWIKGKDFKILLKATSPSSYSYYGALIYKELANQIDLDALEYDLGSYSKEEIVWLFSENFIKEDEIFISGGEMCEVLYNSQTNEKDSNKVYGKILYNSLEFVPQLIAGITKIKKVSMDQIMNDLLKMHVLDVITCNRDRHAENWGILFNRNGTARIAPVYDSEFIFKLNLDKSKYGNINNQLDSCSLIEEEASWINFFNFSAKTKGTSAHKELAFLITKSDEKTQTKILKMIKRLDINESLCNVEKKINSKIPEEVCKMVKAIFEKSKNELFEFMIKNENKQVNRQR